MNSTGEMYEGTDLMATAVQFINSTSTHIFLTGKAGTGKTTFLRNLSARTHKPFAVVAPTGIAALNAGGVTVHSQFLLPFGMFIPESNLPDGFDQEGSFFTSSVLARKHPLNSVRKQLLRSIDLLVIDEVSMLRADLLDAIDYRLKAARGNFSQSFGGVQLLLIGDLYQLPPVVKREEEANLKRFYTSAWFFESKALKQNGFVYIELDKIFRQQDDIFIGLLNNLRNNRPTQQDIDELNKYHKSEQEIQNLREVITLTTHNYKADELNAKALDELKTPAHIIPAYIEGDFPDAIHPVLQHLQLKAGAQIMFTKNDSEGRMYFNGKLATVTKIAKDEVTVEMAGTHVEYTLKKEVWENKRYIINPATHEIEDDVIGTFEQYPVKLAWAITVHKSQGLTFDRAIIDVSQAFADGQVYVALSRLRSLQGLVMRTRIHPGVISTDRQIVTFTEENDRPQQLQATMKTKQDEYIRELVDKTFDFGTLIKENAYTQRNRAETPGFEEGTMKPVLEQIAHALTSERENTEKFRRQLHVLLEANDQPRLIDRLKKGSAYYKQFLQQNIAVLLRHLEEMKQKKRVRAYLTSLTDLDQLFSKKLEDVDKAVYLTECILEGHYDFNFASLAEQRVQERTQVLTEIQSKATPKKSKKGAGKSKKEEVSTYDLTLGLFKHGMTPEAIAKERGLATSTIEGHLAKAVEKGLLDIDKLLSEADITLITQALQDMPEGFTSKDLFFKLGSKFSYGMLRAVMSYAGIKSSHPKGEKSPG